MTGAQRNPATPRQRAEGVAHLRVLEERQIVLFLLARGEGPLLELLLVPIHLELELVHAFVALEHGALDSVHLVLQHGQLRLQLLVLGVEASTLCRYTQ